jgi:glyoxylase-like metal-dependent hydrolase (beta-lactamase superfamily II)
MEPPSARLVNGAGSWFSHGHLVGHCLVLELASGLGLVDAGFGLADVAAPAARLGRPFVLSNRPRLRAEDTAVHQLARLGHSAREVRHIVLTHLDPDHAGGISDFPEAEVHVLGDELEAAMHPLKAIEKLRYRRQLWAHGPRWVPHPKGGERWHGFESVTAAVGAEVLLVPLWGHSRGHVAVAIDTGRGWMLHCGDAYFSHGEIATDEPRCPPLLRLVQWMDEVDRRARLTNRDRLRALATTGEVQLFCAHDPGELAAFAS